MGGVATAGNVRVILLHAFSCISGCATSRRFEDQAAQDLRAIKQSTCKGGEFSFTVALQVFKVITVAFRRHQLAWNEAHGCRVDTVSQAAAINGAI